MRIIKRATEPSHVEQSGLDLFLVAYGHHDGTPILYFCDRPGSYSMIWRGETKYPDAPRARLAAAEHAKRALASMLNAQPEHRIDTWLRGGQVQGANT